MNELFYGDCLRVMEQELKSNSVDLIYLDPPFNSNRNYNMIYTDETGRPLPDQIEAFCDIWTLDADKEAAIRQLPELPEFQGIDPEITNFWKIWMLSLGNTNKKLLAYLYYMLQRLVQMKLLLKPTGSIFLHCDPTYSHYIKVIMDGIFSHHNFQNEIVWYYKNASRGKKRFAKAHDIILWYSKMPDHYVFNRDDIVVPFESKMTEWRYKKGGQAGQEMPKGKTPDDVIIMPSLNTMAKERKGYPTQKPLELLKQIIKASSNEGDVIFDPFCGCATTIVAAHQLKRRWKGIDIAYHTINQISRDRLQDDCNLVEGEDYKISGVPRSMEGAKDLWERDKYHFETWAISIVDAFPTANRTRDGGADGRLYFYDGDETKGMKIEVKGGQKIRIESLRALAGVLDENNPMGGFITRVTLSETQKANFLDFCREKGEIEINNKPYSRLQILSVEEILEGKRFKTPPLTEVRTSHNQPNPQLNFLDEDE